MITALDRDVRLNPAYRLRSSAELSEAEVGTLRKLGVDSSMSYWVLTADPSTGLPDKVVDPSGADLLMGLVKPGRFPGSEARLLYLMFDDVLQVGSASGFVGGPAAYMELAGDEEVPSPLDRLATLSRDAVAYAERLEISSVEQVTARLYCYHRIPLKPAFRHRFPGPGSVLHVMGDDDPRSHLTRYWTRYRGVSATEDWISWHRSGEGSVHTALFPYKLYVSPGIDAVEDAMPPMVEALTESGALAFKVGPDAAGLLRPDKAVVYLRDAQELDRVARAVGQALDGIPAHGVPFTAELAGKGLLSWGGDPRAGEEPLGAETESWRISVCRRLAEGLAASRRGQVRPGWGARFAVARLALDGVDVTSFAPAGLEPPAVSRDLPGPEPVVA